ncbi:hypothetical protein D9619_003348 [Psilocybe cf. subviscida]|uniref:peptidyl-tRNA hydrolase n=1 Tax=Psilocybe cf. subviscida TaxID=2480587 RepID=A0A8H5EU50_9AGAR|nr:hypothetical protein D9619_003348 [Psilocybe cf. subviscida]
MMNAKAAVTYATLVVASLSLGYLAGVKNRKVTIPTTSSVAPAAKATQPENSVVEPDGFSDEGGNESDDSDASSDADGDIAALRVEDDDNCKMVLVVRTDLGMTSGKIAAQCSHAALACYKTLQAKNPAVRIILSTADSLDIIFHPQMLRRWERDGQTKVALKCDNEEEMLVMQAQAQSLNLCARSIQDAGRTQIAAGSRTVLGITGPARLVNQITGKLRLL